MKNKLISRVLFVSLCLALVFSALAGCGDKEKDTLNDNSSLDNTASAVQIDSSDDVSSAEDAPAAVIGSASSEKSGKTVSAAGKTSSGKASSKKSTSSKKTSSQSTASVIVNPTTPGTNEVTVPENWSYDEEETPSKKISPVSTGDGADIYTEWPEGFSK